jgi:hypothetical protein
MNKWIKRVIVINVIFVIIYVLSDYAVWMGIPADMGIRNEEGTFQNLKVETNYNVFSKSITFSGNYQFLTPLERMGWVSQSLNLPLFVFLAMILTNILLLREAIRKSV